MNITDTDHDLAWTAPQPFWNDAAGGVATGQALRRPQILRFTTDEFMNELLATLAHAPASLPGYAAMEETWRGPGATPAPDPQRWLQRLPARIMGARRQAVIRKRAESPAPAPAPAAAPVPLLKLYQPAHMRHYLVGGALVCRTPGLPDRRVDPARQKVALVLRRLMPRASGAPGAPLPDPLQRALWDEYAFVPNGKAGVWRRVAAADQEDALTTVLGAEERLPLFPANYTQDDGHPRRLYLGSVPVGRREAYQSAAAETGAPGAPGGGASTLDPRIVLLHTQVLGPWKALVNRAMANGSASAAIDDAAALLAARPETAFARQGDGIDRNTPDLDAIRTMRGGLQTASWYLLLDLNNYLQEQLGTGFLLEGATRTAAAQALYDALDAAAMPAALAGDPKAPLVETDGDYDADHVESNLVAALRRIAPFAASLEAARGSFAIRKPGTPAGSVPPASSWPDFLFLFADPWLGILRPPAPPGFSPPADDYLAEKIQACIDALATLVQAALPPLDATARVAEPTLASMQPADMREAWYVMRLVYERPDCAPFHANVVSAATHPFRMAGFFDADAPARPVRIGLPLDISPAGLRKFDKNAVFMMSDMLCGQVDRMKGMGLGDLVLSVLPWPFHKSLNVPEKGDCKTGDGLSLGVMCSMSIPIITICALLLLMIMVSLLDLIFRWVPYFTVCFPLPGFKGRKD